jgi:O-antigen/teichoic acid export membrane protein
MPAMVVLLSTLGEAAIWLMFSKDFAPSGKLLLWILPFDLLRVVSETTGLALFAKKKLVSYLGCYIIWTGCYLGIASQTIPTFGLNGFCYAYAISHSLFVCIQLVVTYATFDYVPSRSTRLIIVKGFLIAGAASLWVGNYPSISSRILALVTCLLIWGFFSIGTPELTSIFNALKTKFFINYSYLFLHK